MRDLTNEYRHTPVLAEETIELLQLKPESIFVDCTLGGAGHSILAAETLHARGTLTGIDQDPMAIAAAAARLKDAYPDLDFRPLEGDFKDMDELLIRAEIPWVDGFLFDLGLSSPQIDFPERGFSYKEDAPLDMRRNPGRQTLTAAEVINTYNAADLTRILRDYGEERWASRIASFIVDSRASKPIGTTLELVDIIKAAIPANARRSGGHPAKRTFQALRIEVNGELDGLQQALERALAWMSDGARIAVISYHSLEDRIVKDFFSKMAKGCTCPPDLPVCVCGNKPRLEVITRKPIVPSDEEIDANPRARSAKLRVAQRVNAS
ncbi:MAG: 16S rRNA (cytosine(1402)-N(4))-methyltransferase RsmH [Coriobacteriales bacterium]|nr:16S rRNA (cytosine(1402)-N(4))-methyltransferase RsmH [Coriobacteriales bacterium]